MKNLLQPLLVTLLVVTADAEAPQPEYGPPASPLACQEVAAAKASGTPQFTPPSEILGSAKSPTSVRMAELTDGHPFGEGGHHLVWLARYESVAIQAPDTSFAVAINLSLAIDAATGHLLCAFSDPAPQWARSSLPSVDIEERVRRSGWEAAPAHYDDLRSTLPAVLEALWKRFSIDPSKTGQVILRPRFVSNRFPTNEVEGKAMPMYPPSNSWVVEVLGTVIMERHGALLTTLVAQFRDGDLKGLPGSIQP